VRTILLADENSSVKKVLRSVNDNEIQEWIYLGQNYKKLLLWKKSIGTSNITHIYIGRQVNEVAWHLRQSYIDWIEKMGRPYGTSLEWWTSIVGDKNTFVSPLFLYLCYHRLCEQLFEDNEKKNVLLIIENRGLLKTLAQVLQQKDCRVYFASNSLSLLLKDLLKRYVWFAGSWALLVINVMKYQFAARITKKEDIRHKDIGSSRPAVIIHTSVGESCFGDDHQFHDLYFPGLAEWLTRQGYDVFTLPFLFNINRSVRDAYHWFRKSNSSFLIPEDYLTGKDYLKSIRIILRQFFVPRGKVFFKEWDLTSLIIDLRWRQASNRSNIRFLSYIPMLRCLSNTGLNLRLFIDKFENMPKEKPQIIGLRQYFPECTIVGYQHASLPPFMLKYTTTKREFFDGPFPDCVVSNGPWFKERLAADGVPVERIKIGPTLRSGDLISKSRQNEKATKKPLVKKHEKSVLVTLSLVQNMAIELLEIVFDGLSANDFKVLIKPHPMSDRRKILRKLGRKNLPSGMEWVSGTFQDWLAKVDCIVATGSATIMEAVASGVPIVIVGRECGLDMNPLGWWVNQFPVLSPVYSSKRLRVAVEKILKMDREAIHQQVNEMRDTVLKAYNTASDASMSSFLP